MPKPSGLLECRDICAGYPWVREVWLLTSASASGGLAGHADLLVVCDRPPKAVGSGQRKRFLGDLRTRTELRLEVRLATADQLSKWLSQKGRFAAVLRSAARLYP
jgi:hypothetical protein